MFKKISPILALNLVNILGFSILIPILPSIVATYNGSDFMYGLLISIYSMFQFFASPLMGSLSDIYGRRPVLILSQAGTLLSWVIFGSAYFLPNIDLKIASLPILVIFISRVFDGITGGNTTVANAYLADITTNEEKTKAFGYVGAIFGVGFLIGPVIGAMSYDSSLSYAGTAIVSALISLITLLLIIFKLPESLPEEKRTTKVKTKLSEKFNLYKRINKLDLDKKMRNLFTLRFFFSMAFTGYTGIIILYLNQHYNLTEGSISYVLLLFGVYAIINQSALVPRLAKKFGELSVYYIGYFALIISMAAITIKMPLWAFIALGYIVSISIDSCTPTFKAIISNYMSDSKQGEAQGIDEAFQAVGRATAPLITTALYSYINQLTFGVISLVLIIPLLFLGFIKLPKLKRKMSVENFDNIPFNE